MGDYTDNSRPTFLSRVLGTGSATGTGRGQTNEESTPFRNDFEDNRYLAAEEGYSYEDGRRIRELIMSEVSLADAGTDARRKRSNLDINFNSESEDEDDESSAESDGVERDDGDGRLSRSQQNKIRHELENELDLGMVDDNFDPESLYSRGNRNLFAKLEESVIFQVREVERNIRPTITNLTQRAKHLAIKTIENSTILNQEPTFISNRAPNTTTNSKEQMRRQVFNARKLPPIERAKWMWANVTNLDVFLTDVYSYYVSNGWLCMLLSRMSDSLIIVFVVWLTSFLGNCIDYNTLFNEKVNGLSQVYDGKCYAQIPFTQKIFYYILFFLLAIRTKNSINELMEFREIKLFYNYLLDIDDSELQTISWPQIVKKIMILKNQNTNAIVNNDKDHLQSKSKLNAHDIANRLMRRENYMIAMFNKNIITKSLKVPFFRMQFLTKTLEWNIKLCILDYLFNEQGQLKGKVLSQHHRLSLITNLKKRFRIAGLLGIFISPFLVLYFIMYYFLKLFYDFKTNPGLLNARSYSPYAKWKMREYNELPHLFDQRINLSIEHAENYLTQFPKEVSNIILKFVAFISGSLVTILVILTVIDHENFLNFEITEGKTTLFYISTLGAVFTVCKNSISDTNSRYLFDPETSLKEMSKFTHYLPNAWENRYHTIEVKNQFCDLYNLKLYLIFKELCSLIFLPYILYFSLPNSCDKIVDFFRDYSVHVDGIGYVCSFAMFNLEENKDKVKTKMKNNTSTNIIDDSNEKMMKSYIHFVESYSDAPTDNKHKVFQNPTHNLIKKHTGNNLLKSAILNKRTNGTSNGHGNGGIFKSTGLSNVPESEQGSSNGFMNDMNNSMLLGESFHIGYTRGTETNNVINEDIDSEDDELSKSANGGVLGLLNQVYKYK